MERFERGLEIFHDVPSDLVRRRPVVHVLEAVVFQPEDVEVQLVPLQQVRDIEAFEAFGFLAFGAITSGIAVLEVFQVGRPQGVLFQREVVVGEEMVDPQCLAVGRSVPRGGFLSKNAVGVEPYRENQRQKRLFKIAKLKTHASVEDINYEHKRGIDRSQMASLTTCDWITRRLNLILTGPTGSGKTWLACALGHKACQLGKSVLFHRAPLLLEELHLAHADGSFRKRLAQLAKVDLLILDDFGMGAINAQGRADLLEVVDSRVEGRSTLVTSQLPVEKWHDYLSSGNPTAADAILHRLVSGSIRVPLIGESMRKRMTK